MLLFLKYRKQSSKSFQKPTGPVTVCLGTSSSSLFSVGDTYKCLYEARGGPARGPYEPHDPSIGGPVKVTVRCSYGPKRGRAGLVQTFTCLLRVKYRREPVSESCASSISATGYIWRPYGSKILHKKIVRARTARRTGPHGIPWF